MKKTKGGLLISRIKQIQDRVLYKKLEQNGINISSGQGRILYVLWQENPLTISEIGKRTSLAKTTLTAMLDRMESKSIIVRSPDKLNRRQILIFLTEDAKLMKDKYQQISDEMTQVYYNGFSDTEIDEFENKLEKIVANLQNEEKELK